MFFSISWLTITFSHSVITILGKTGPTIIHKIFETNSSFHVKQRTTGTVQFLFFSSFLLLLTKFLFWEEDWALGYNSMKFRHFPDIS